MIPLNINFLKSQPTVGELRKVTREALQSPINLPTKGDKFVARKGNNQPPQDGSMGFFTFFQGNSVSLDAHNLSLMPQTFNYTKLNNAKRNLEWQQAEKELGLIQL